MSLPPKKPLSPILLLTAIVATILLFGWPYLGLYLAGWLTGDWDSPDFGWVAMLVMLALFALALYLFRRRD